MSRTQHPDRTPDRKRSRAMLASHRDPAELAPGVDRAWVDEFVLEQRLLGVPGAAIGDALVTVASHVEESGEGAHEAFGEPRAYAREVAEGRAGTAPGVSPLTVVGSVLGVLGMVLAGYAFTAVLADEPVALSTGLLAGTGLLLAALAGFLASADAVLRAVVTRGWVVAVGTGLVVTASVALIALLRRVVLELPAAPVLAAALGAVLLSSALAWLDNGRDDSVLAPGEPAPTRPAGRLSATLVMPGFTVLLLGFTWVLHLVTGA